MARPRLKGSTNQSVTVYIVDSTDGTPEEGVVHNTTGIAIWYRREGAVKVPLTLVTLASASAAHTDSGFIHIDDGVYRLDLPDAAFATGAGEVTIGGTVATGMVVLPQTIALVDYNNQDAAKLGLSGIANVTEINATVDTALSDIHLDHLLAADYDPASKPGTATALLNELVENDSGVSRFTTNALEQGPSGGGGTVTIDAASVDAIWNEPKAGHTTSGTYGYYLDAQISGISSTTPPTAGAIADAVWSELVVDQTVSGSMGVQLGTTVNAIQTAVNTLNTTKLPDVVSLANIRTEADAANTSIYLDQIVANALTPGTMSANSLFGELTEDNAGTQRFTTAALAQGPTGSGESASTIAAAVWNGTRSSHTTSGSFGESLQTIVSTPPTAAANADAVWDEARASHSTAASFGEALQTVVVTPPTAANNADAVWDESTTSHTTSGTFGEQLKTDVDAILSGVGSAIGSSSLYIGTIASLTSQTVMRLATTFPSQSESLTGHIAVFQDASDAAKLDAVRITAYNGSTGDITLERAPVITVAAGTKLNVQVATPGASDARILAQVNAGLVALGLDHLVSATVAGADVADNSIVARLASKSATADWDTYNQTTDSLEAIADATANETSLLSTTIAGKTNATTYSLTVGPEDNNSLLNQTVVFRDVSTANQLSVRKITSWNGSTLTMVVDSDPDFVVVATDKVEVYATTIPPTAAQVRAEIDSNSTRLATNATNVSAVITTQGSHTTTLGAVKTETDKIAATQTSVNANATTLGLVKTETDKLPATITKIDAVKTETDKVPATITKIDAVKTETDKVPATITKIDAVKTATDTIATKHTALLARHTTADTSRAAIKAKTDLISSNGGSDTATLAAIATLQTTANTINTTTAGHTTNIGLITTVRSELGDVATDVTSIDGRTSGWNTNVNLIDEVHGFVNGFSTSGIALTSAAETSLVSAINTGAVGSSNVTVTVANYGQLTAGTITLKEGQKETLTFTGGSADLVPDLSTANTVILFGIKGPDGSFAVRTTDAVVVTATGTQKITVNLSATEARKLIPGRASFDLFALYGYTAATQTYTDAQLFASGKVQVDSANIQFVI